MRMIPALLTALLLTAPAFASPPLAVDDAPLHALQFIDKDEGWAVGDDGVILHTVDAGKSWELQSAPTRGSLRGIHFINPLVGWAVGRDEQPTGSVGIVLATRDGGANWQRQEGLANTLPGINALRFADPLNNYVAYLLADSSDQFPSGLFKTVDAGKSWAPVRGPRAPAWFAAEFSNVDSAVLVGPWASLARLTDGQVEFADLGALAGRSLKGIRKTHDRLLAVGAGGVVLSSASQGKSWGFAKLPMSAETRACVDFHAITSHGKRMWIVGRPGSFVLRSDDAGDTWELLKTGQRLPLNAVHFHDADKGWAVGAGGTILATTDGGASWNVCRQGARRAAVLVVHPRAHDLPADTLASLGAERGNFTTTLCVQAPDPQSAAPRHALQPQRLDAAQRQLGGLAAETLWHFPLPQYLQAADKEAILASWNDRFSGKAGQEMLRQLVLALRIWQPEVVLAVGQDSAGALWAETLREATTLAENPDSFPEQIKDLGLAAWKVQRTFAESPRGKHHIEQDNLQPYDRLEGTLRDFAGPAYALVRDTQVSLPTTRYFQQEGTAPKGADLASSVGEVRRKLHAVEPDPEARKATQTRTHLISLAEKLAEPSKLLSALEPALKQLTDLEAASAALAIADDFARQGQWQHAKELYLHVMQRYPAHPGTLDACRWLIRHASSSEVRRRYELDQFFTVTKTTTQGVQQAGAIDPQQTVQQAFLAGGNETKAWHQFGVTLGQHLGNFGPLHTYDPAMQFCLQSARRKLGETDKALDFYEKFHAFVPQGPWHEAAKAELWLVNRSKPEPERVGVCKLADARPLLDGKFDDVCWEKLTPMVLGDAVGGSRGDYASQLMLAYDQEFLYIALRCTHPAGQRVPQASKRKRDENLQPYDRVALLFDLDRDYSTFFRFEVDQRGCVREDCWGDGKWNPKWFVACHQTDTSWQIEAAIPLSEMTREAIPLNAAWAFNAVRVIPGKGVQSWSLPADVDPRPEGMSVLLFQERTKASKMPPP